MVLPEVAVAAAVAGPTGVSRIVGAAAPAAIPDHERPPPEGEPPATRQRMLTVWGFVPNVGWRWVVYWPDDDV